jgi:hypothetical protein
MSADPVLERYPRVRILLKVVVSFGVGAIAYWLTELTGQEQIWSLTMSLFIGGVTLVVQLLMEFEARLARLEIAKARHSAQIESMVEEGFAKISEATELFSLIETSALRADVVTQLVRHATLIEPAIHPLVSRFAQAQVGRLSDVLKELGEGGILLYEGEDRDWLLTLVREVQSTIDATSVTTVDARGGGGYVDSGFWSTDLGLRYLAEQREAVGRGVRIRRLFIVEGEDGADDAGLAEICESQQAIGIDVRVLRADAIPPTLRNFTYDFILFDGVVGYETRPASLIEDRGQPTILQTRLDLRGGQVVTQLRRFEELWATAGGGTLASAALGR